MAIEARIATITTTIMSSTNVNPLDSSRREVPCFVIFVSLMRLSQLNPGLAVDSDVRWQFDLHRLHRRLRSGGRDDRLADQPSSALMSVDHGQSAGLVRRQTHHVRIIIVVDEAALEGT